MTCGECKNVTAPGAGFPNHVYCKRFLLHMEKQKDASNCNYFIPTLTTNADRVRTWTDEEIAEFVVGIACRMYELINRDVLPAEVCEKMRAELLDCLKKEAF